MSNFSSFGNLTALITAISNKIKDKAISNLKDVQLTNISDGQILAYNASSQKFKNVNPSGASGAVLWTEREGYVGKNLMPCDLNGMKNINTTGTWNNNVYTKNGITFTVNSDGSVTIDGTAITSTATLTLFNSTTTNILRERILNKEITISGAEDSPTNDCYFYFYNFNGQGNSKTITSSGLTFTFSNSSADFNMSIAVTVGTVVDNLTFYPMIRLSSISDSTYEPYLESNIELAEKIAELEDISSLEFKGEITDSVDNKTTSGIYQIHNTVTGMPDNLTWCPFIVIDNGYTNIHQLCFKGSAKVIYIRSLQRANPITWNPWYKIIDSTEIATLLAGKVDKVTGKALSTNDFTNEEKAKADNAVLWSERKGYVGKNLLVFPYSDSFPVSKNGIDFSVNSDGSITVDGTASADAVVTLSNRQYGKTPMPEVGTYAVTNITSGIKVQVFYTLNGSWTLIKSLDGVNGNFTITQAMVDTESPLGFELVVKNGTTVSNQKIYPMIRHASISDDTYEPHLISNTELQDKSVFWEQAKEYVGKNKGKIENGSQTDRGVTFTSNNGVVTFNGTATAYSVSAQYNNFATLPAGSYIFTGCPSDGGLGKYQIGIFKNGEGTAFGWDTGSGYEFTLTETTTIYIKTYAYQNYGKFTNFNMYPMIRLASIADGTYEPYLPTNTELKSNIGNLSNLTTTAKTNLVAAINEAAQGGGSSTLADLTDTSITNPEQGQTLRYEVVSGVGKWYNSASADMYKSDFAKYGLNGIVDNAMAVQLLYGDFDKLTRLSTDFIQLWDDTPTSYSFTFAGNSYAIGDNLVCFIDTIATMRNKVIFFDGYSYSYTDTNGGEIMADRLTDTAIINEIVPSDCDVTKPFSISVSIVGPVIGNACCYKGTGANTTSYPTSVSNTRFFKTTDGKLGFYNSVDGTFNLMGGGGGNPILPINPTDQTYKITPGAIWIET